ncbi:MAG TPA: PH domain-containing protein [Kofleriaceae bacterium]
MRPLLFVPLLGGAASIYVGNVRDDQRALFVAYACLIAYGLLMFGLAWPIRYTVSPEELEVRFGLVHTHLPWDRIVAMELSNSPLSSPAMSLDRIEIRYIHKSGSFERTIRISPPDREAFLADCARASGKHHVVDGTLVRT